MPLHAAAWKGAPLTVIRRLAEAHPPSATDLSPTHFMAASPVFYSVFADSGVPAIARYFMGKAPTEVTLKASSYRGVTALHVVSVSALALTV